jgi:hypothetical protein
MTVVFVGNHLSARDRILRDAADRSGEEAIFLTGHSSLEGVLDQRLPRCVLTGCPESTREANRILRARADCCSVPLIGLVEQMSSATMVELHRLGADDIALQHDGPGLLRRLSALSRFDPRARTTLSQGPCLLAHPEPYRRQVLGRVLRQAGFDVSFAESSAEAVKIAERIAPKVVIVADDLPLLGGEKTLTALSERWLGKVPAVLLQNEGDRAGPPQWPVVSGDGPPDDLLFVVNELLSPRELVDARSSRRLLLATLCGFRRAGDLENRFGLTYNVSREGLYVRTFDAPSERGAVWIELRPPGADLACHLRGEIVWMRTMATGARGASPPGFGVRLRDEQCPSQDLRIFRDCYDALLERSTP